MVSQRYDHRVHACKFVGTDGNADVGYSVRPSTYPAVNLASLLVMSGKDIADCDELQVRLRATQPNNQPSNQPSARACTDERLLLGAE